MKGGGSNRSGATTAKRPQTTGAPSFTSADARQCAVDLRQAGVTFTPLPNTDHCGGCSSNDSVQQLDIGTPLTNLGSLTCPRARHFEVWVDDDVRPAARISVHPEVGKVEHGRTFSCLPTPVDPKGRVAP